MLQIFDHPWITKYSRRYEESSDEEKQSTTSEESIELVEEGVLQNQLMFNIQEHENETTGNYVPVDII